MSLSGLQLAVDATHDQGADTGPRLLGCTATASEPLAQHAGVRSFSDRIIEHDTGRFVGDFASHIYIPYGRTSPSLISVVGRPDTA